MLIHELIIAKYVPVIPLFSGVQINISVKLEISKIGF
jgi:hypothetical protein